MPLTPHSVPALGSALGPVPTEEPTLPLSIKFAWASGTFGVSILSNGVSALMLFYLTTIVGIAGWIAGLILMISKLYDVITQYQVCYKFLQSLVFLA